MQFVIAAYLLVNLVYADVINDTVITNEYFPEQFVKITSEYDIVDVVYPSNNLRFNGNYDQLIFIILVDNTSGERVDKGLYIRDNFKITKLLDCARDITSPNGDTYEVYFASEDGIYSYNVAKNTAEKYGNITDNIISIVKQNANDSLYVLTKDHIIYKITEEGTKKEELIQAENTQHIAMDNQRNLYWATNEAVFKYSTSNKIQRIEGLPKKWHYINILRPSISFNNGVMIVVDSDVYIAYVNGTTTRHNLKLETRPTAYVTSGQFLQAYAVNKKLYEYNLFEVLYSNTVAKAKILNMMLQIA